MYIPARSKETLPARDEDQVYGRNPQGAPPKQLIVQPRVSAGTGDAMILPTKRCCRPGTILGKPIRRNHIADPRSRGHVLLPAAAIFKRKTVDRVRQLR